MIGKLPGALTILISVFWMTGASANPIISEQWRAYPVDANSADALLSQMERRGPNGFWAFTKWHIRWTSNCIVSVDIDYTIPQHSNPAVMPNTLRGSWARMTSALLAHERKHGALGIAAANELIANNCRRANRIIRKWSKQNRDLDVQTRHGQTEGVTFP